MIRFIILLIVGLIVLALIIGWYRTYKTQHSANQTAFLAGTVPNPDGFYPGTVGVEPNLGWQGKYFDQATGTGINVFKEGQLVEKYPFRFYEADAVRDTNKKVVRIDYNQKGNPLYVRHITDEIVEVAPNEFLGKIHFNFLGLKFALGYFHLKK